MTNEINGLPRSRPQESGDTKGAKGTGVSAKATAAGGNPPAPARTDTVRLSDAAARLQRLQASVADMPVVDQQRVSALKREIENGSYRVDPDRVAAKLLDLERTLGLRK
jgi:negative regulator of flagellin synthesis FlgM